MGNKSKVSLSVILACTLCCGAANAITISNASRGGAPSRADAYNQVAMMQQQAQYEQQQLQAAATTPDSTVAAVAAMPVKISNPNVANSIARGDDTYGVNINDIDACSSIYPNGKMVWDRPNAGLRRTGGDTCAVQIEMRAISGNSDIVLATAVVAAGDTIDCNISAFPQNSYTDAAGEIVFPADKEPTMSDVERVMNEEQKQNAALKIAAGAVVGAVAGNFTGASDTGAALGTNKEKMQNTVIGALGAAGLMTASAYSGKVVGDTILSTGVNAAAGAAVGNMMATGTALLIKDCDVNGSTKCLYGVVQKYDSNTVGTRFYNLDTGKTVLCKEVADNSKCEQKNLIGFTINSKYPEDWASNNFYELRNNDTKKYCLNPKTNTMDSKSGACADTWVEATGGGTPLSPVAAMIPNTGMKFGKTASDFALWRAQNPRPLIYERKNDGTAGRDLRADGYNASNFYPTYQDASDGGIIDFNNAARTKGTLIGAGAGGAMGGLSGYMGATSDVEQRWVTAVTEYKDSLQKIYCGTGTRFLGSYNDVIIVPVVKKTGQN